VSAGQLRIACIGRAGQTAQALAAIAVREPALELIAGGRERLDLKAPASLARFLDEARPDAVINAAAYNLVDRAESEPDEAMRINAEGPAALARLCRERGLSLIHMSTDCVFDGAKAGLYVEDDTPHPLSAYGRSKLAGEEAVLAEDRTALVIRVCWVFSEFGDSFVSKMIELARTRPSLRVVSDQIGPPTYAPDIARALLSATRARRAAPDTLCGRLHVASPDALSRDAMARAILAESQAQGGPSAAIEPILTSEFAALAPRPLNARLSGARATLALGLAFTPWREALTRSVVGILAREAGQ
jgi:dTDP-4-dehydrorhamnose reductase